jgi:4-hydroxy-4-methyl-2-oxoglutarate aldolase
MGELADAALRHGGRVIGVIPKSLWAREVNHTGLTELYEVGSMHERKQRMYDLSDADKSLRVLPAAIRPVSARSRLIGRAVTANARDDLLSVLGALQHCGPGDVLVVAAGGSRRAVAGELFASEAARRGMAGIVIDGLCRDTATLKTMTLPIYARGATPRAASAMVMPEVNVPVLLGNVTVRPGDILLGDDDGIVVATEAEMAAAIDKAETIQVTEDSLRSSIAHGVCLFDKLNLDEHLKNLHAGQASSLSFEA